MSNEYKGQFVYIFQCEDFLKIGTSQDYKQRYKSLQGANPFRIKILLVLYFKDIKKGLDTEKYLHAKFAEQREIAEWFNFDKSILRYVERKYKFNIIKHETPSCFNNNVLEKIKAESKTSAQQIELFSDFENSQKTLESKKDNKSININRSTVTQKPIIIQQESTIVTQKPINRNKLINILDKEILIYALFSIIFTLLFSVYINIHNKKQKFEKIIKENQELREILNNKN